MIGRRFRSAIVRNTGGVKAPPWAETPIKIVGLERDGGGDVRALVSRGVAHLMMSAEDYGMESSFHCTEVCRHIENETGIVKE